MGERVLSEAQRAVLEKHKFRAGQSAANPRGRPRGLMQRARDASEDGQVCFEYLVAVVEGRVPAKAGERTEAAKLVLAYCGGTPVSMSASVSVEASTDSPIGALGDETIRNLMTILKDIPDSSPAPNTDSTEETPS